MVFIEESNVGRVYLIHVVHEYIVFTRRIFEYLTTQMIDPGVECRLIIRLYELFV